MIARLLRLAPAILLVFLVAPEALPREGVAVVVAVGSVGARSLIRGRLCAMGFVEGPDFVVAA